MAAAEVTCYMMMPVYKTTTPINMTISNYRARMKVYFMTVYLDRCIDKPNPFFLQMCVDTSCSRSVIMSADTDLIRTLILCVNVSPSQINTLYSLHKLTAARCTLKRPCKQRQEMRLKEHRHACMQ